MWWVWCAAALGVEPAVISARLEEVAPLRAKRLAEHAPVLPEEAYAKAAAGQTATGLVQMEGTPARLAWGVTVSDVPIAAYWAAVNDDAGKIKWTKIDYAEILEGEPCGSPRRVFQFLPVPLVTDRWWVSVQRINGAVSDASGGSVREMQWASDGDFSVTTDSAKVWAEQGIHLGFTEGAWWLVALDDSHTLVEYYTWSDPGGSFPAGLASRLAAGGIDDTLAAMTAAAKAGPACPM